MLKHLSRTLPPDSKPVILPQRLAIPPKPKAAAEKVPNGNADSLGASSNGVGMKRKRSPEESTHDQEQLLKRKREEHPSEVEPTIKRGKVDTDDLVIVDDSHNGAILIDD